MRPKMNQSLILEVAKLNENGKPILDKYSRPIVSKSSHVCRTREHGEALTTPQLRVQDGKDEIDVLPDTPVTEGAKVEYTTIGGRRKHGTILSIVETTNLTASKVYFRTCVVDV